MTLWVISWRDAARPLLPIYLIECRVRLFLNNVPGLLVKLYFITRTVKAARAKGLNRSPWPESRFRDTGYYDVNRANHMALSKQTRGWTKDSTFIFLQKATGLIKLLLAQISWNSMCDCYLSYFFYILSCIKLWKLQPFLNWNERDSFSLDGRQPAKVKRGEKITRKDFRSTEIRPAFYAQVCKIRWVLKKLYVWMINRIVCLITRA